MKCNNHLYEIKQKEKGYRNWPYEWIPIRELQFLHHGKCNQIESSRYKREHVIEMEYIPELITGYTEK